MIDVKMRKQKRAEVLTSFTIKVIILIISFVFILAALVVIFGNWEGTIDKGACRWSVIERASFTFGPIETAKSIPLQCKTEQICLSDSKDRCEGVFDDKTKENPISVHRLSKDDEAAKREVLDTISDALYDCNWMLGEGEINFLPTRNFAHNYCIICSRIVFDDEAQKLFPDGIKMIDLYERMEERRLDDGRNYLKAVIGVENTEIIKRDLAIMREKARTGEYSEQEITADKLELDNWKIGTKGELPELAILAKAVTRQSITQKVGVSMIFGGFTALGSLVSMPFAGAKAGAVVGGIAYFKYFPDEFAYYSGPMLITYDPEEFNRQGCQSFENIP